MWLRELKVMIPKFRLGTLLASMTGLVVILGLNCVPERFPTYINNPGVSRIPVNVESYGWPSEIISFYSGDDIDVDLASTLDPRSTTGMLSGINRNRPYRIFKNFLVLVGITFGIGFATEWIYRRRDKKTSELLVQR